MPNKHALEHVCIFAKEKGFTVLSKTYANNRQKLSVVCQQGHVTEKTFHDIMQGHNCFICKGTPKYSLEVVQKAFERAGYELISKDYEGAHEPLLYICKCGRLTSATFHNFRRNKGRPCYSCCKEKLRGDSSPLWNNSITEEERVIQRKYDAYNQWRTAVYSRDGFACQVCFDGKGGNLVAHHLEGYTHNKELRTEVSNGVTLCRNCHIAFHKVYGNGGNTRTQFKEFSVFRRKKDLP